MDYRLSYTRDDTPYDADQEFLDAILRLNRESRLKVLVQIEKSSEFFYRTHRDFTFEEVIFNSSPAIIALKVQPTISAH